MSITKGVPDTETICLLYVYIDNHKKVPFFFCFFSSLRFAKTSHSSHFLLGRVKEMNGLPVRGMRGWSDPFID